MKTYELSLLVCLWRLENGTVMAESSSIPELSCAGNSPRDALARLKRGATKLAQRLPRLELARRDAVADAVLEYLPLTLEPPVRSPAWESAITIKFAIAVWPHETDGWVVWVPVLGIHVLGRSEAEVRQRVEGHLKAAIARESANWTLDADGICLPRLSELQRSTRARLIRVKVPIPFQTPKSAAQLVERENPLRKSVLEQTTENLNASPIPPTFGNGETIFRIAAYLTGQRPRSVLLVGPSGVGKTAAFRELARQRERFGLSSVDFRATSGSRLVAGMSGFGMWQERCQSLCRDVEKTSCILHLGSLFELMEVGRCEGNSTGIATFLQPYLVRGVLLAVAECTAEQLALVERLHPQLIQTFEIVRVDEPDTTASRQILTQFAEQFPRPIVRNDQGTQLEIALIDQAGISAIERLHRRYATYSAFPGRPLRFLRNLLRDRFDRIQLSGAISSRFTKSTPSISELNGNSANNTLASTSVQSSSTQYDRPLSESDIIAAFSREAGLPTFLLDDRVSFHPGEARDTLQRRVIGQQQAVERVVTLLSTIKAGLARPGRPLATLLFIGPTGVGKTELARTLAEYLFGDEGRLTRLDMSEFSDPISAQRLIGGLFAEEGVLTAKIREQPFSVVLLDEFEKSDPVVFDLMLQVLGEGRLTDGSGRLADFTNSVIVMTSNLGAESYQRGVAGFTATHRDAQGHFLEAVRQYFRPELFNRFDAVIAFDPLTLEDLRSIAELQVNRVRQRDGLLFRDRGWKFDAQLLDDFAVKGLDPRYGARPLKRTIERELLAPLSAQLNSVLPERAVTIHVAKAAPALTVAVTPYSDSAGRAVDWNQQDPGIATMLTRVTALRRRTRNMLGSTSVRSLRNESYRLETQLERERRRMLKRTAVGKPWKPEYDYQIRLTRAASLKSLLSELEGLGCSVDTMEDQALLGLLIENRARSLDSNQIESVEREWWRVARDVYLQQFPVSDKVTIAVFSGYAAALTDLVGAYREVLTSLGFDQAELWEYSRVLLSADAKRVEYDDPDVDAIWQRLIRDPKKYLNQIPEPVVGLAWSVRGKGGFAQLQSEAGLHVFQKGQNKSLCMTFVDAVNGADFEPMPRIGRKGAINQRGKKDRRREYNFDQAVATDPLVSKALSWRQNSLGATIGELIRLQFESDIMRTVIGPENSADVNQ